MDDTRLFTAALYMNARQAGRHYPQISYVYNSCNMGTRDLPDMYA